jgi:glycopeptide antibiotics resistance protein
MSDVDDVILNTAGVILGYWLWQAAFARGSARFEPGRAD